MEAAVAIKSGYETERNKPMPSVNHSIIQRNLLFQLMIAYRDKFDFLPEIKIARIDAEKDKVPDIAIAKEVKFRPGSDSISLEDIPPGIIEILSPKQHLSDLVTKSELYFKAGVQSYWLVLPDLRSIYVFDQIGEYEVFTYRDKLVDKVLNLELVLADIFK